MFKYTARISNRSGRLLYQSGEHESREAAMHEAFDAQPLAKGCTTGYGYAGGFDIRWHKRDDSPERKE